MKKREKCTLLSCEPKLEELYMNTWNRFLYDYMAPFGPELPLNDLIAHF